MCIGQRPGETHVRGALRTTGSGAARSQATRGLKTDEAEQGFQSTWLMTNSALGMGNGDRNSGQLRESGCQTERV